MSQNYVLILFYTLEKSHLISSPINANKKQKKK